MKHFTLTAVIASLLLAGTGLCRAQEMPEMPTPQPEHEWLQQFVGEWESEAECTMEPGQPSLEIKGTETARMLGGFWLVAEGKSEIMEMPFSNILTLGYDPEKQKYVGTWVDSMTGYLWRYEGSLDETGRILTLETEGPCPRTPGRLSKFKDVTEFKNKDHRVFTSSVQGEDGEWTTMVTGNFWRKK